MNIEEYGYAWEERPDAEVIRVAKRLARSARHQAVLDAFGLAFPFHVGPVKLGRGHAARFLSGTAGSDRRGIIALETRRFGALDGWRLEEEVDKTLLHEYGHALFDTSFAESERPSSRTEEKIVEAFATLALRDPAAAIKLVLSARDARQKRGTGR